MITKGARECCQLVALRGQHAALARRDRLARVEAERAAVAERAGVSTAIPAAERAGCVLDHPQPVTLREGEHGIEIGREPEEVHRDDPDRSLRHERVELFDVQVVRVEVDVDEHGLAAALRDDVRRRDPREAGDDHLVAGTDVERHHRDLQRRRARARCDRVLGAGVRSELLLELGDERALDDPAGLKRPLHGTELLLAEERLGDRDRHGREPIHAWQLRRLRASRR